MEPESSTAKRVLLVRTNLDAQIEHTISADATVSDGRAALAALAARPFDLVLVQAPVDGLDAMWLLKHIRRAYRRTEVIVLGGAPSIDEAKHALKEGAFEYFALPVAAAELRETLSRVVPRVDTDSGPLLLDDASEIVGRSPKMVQLLERIDVIAKSDAPVLITGESGTGKELIARAIHQKSGRADGPFVAINCASFPDTLIEAELFGHERGAFTGAARRRDGRFRSADGGTILLDEVGEMSLAAQAKLLRVLQEGVLEPLGADASIKVNVRIVSATHRRLKDLIAAGRFREDLYFRLKVLDVRIAPLRERASDLPVLVEHFLQAAADPGGRPQLSARAWAALTSYAFPGNVRELEHAIRHAVVLAGGGDIDLEHLPFDIIGSFSQPPSPSEAPKEVSLTSLDEAVSNFERQYLKQALRATGGKRTETAKRLGISRRHLWAKLKALGISDEE